MSARNTLVEANLRMIIAVKKSRRIITMQRLLRSFNKIY